MPVLSLLLAVPSLSDALSAQSHLTRTNTAGPHSVGLRVVEQYDRFRGYRDVIRAGDAKESVAILRLNAELHGESWNAFDSLGEAYAQVGNKPMAADCFQKSLAMNPKNTNAVAWLKQLGATP